ncbi:MAG: CoA-binding protein [Chloroflexota bacterium]
MKVDFAKLDRAFNAKVLAVVGDSKENFNFHWLRAHRTFTGKLYSVQISPKSIEGIKELGIDNYPSVVDIPEPVDLVIVSSPRRVALQILEDCIRKGVAAATFFTAGFTETGTEEGKELERQLVARATEANFHLIGPNCMGIFNPKVGLKQRIEQYSGQPGPVGLISQSGTHAINFSLEAQLQGLYVNKSVSFGNGRVLDSADFIEYFGADPEIKAIGMYLEGVRNGEKFLRILKQVSAKKPVVIWKGGRTQEGGRAIASHTGSLAVSRAIWDAAIRQCGAIGVDRIEELIDTLKALIFLPPVYGDRVGISGVSGGQSVAIADAFAEVGLKVPPPTRESCDKLLSFYSLIGGGYLNPIDTGNANRKDLKRIMEVLEQDANMDNLILMISARRMMMEPEDLQEQVDLLSEIKQRTTKPVVAITAYSTYEEARIAIEITQKLQERGIVKFPSLERAAKALRNALDYYTMKKGIVESKSEKIK